MKWARALLVLLLAVPAGGCKEKTKRDTKAPTTVVAAPTRAKFENGVKHMEAGAAEYDDAIRAFKAAANESPDLWEAWHNIGIIELRRARLSAAADAFEKSIDIYPSPEALEGLGEIYLRQGRSKRAVELYEQALSRNPADTNMRVRLAVSLRHAGKLDAAEVELRAVLGQSSSPEAYATLAAIQVDREKLDLAELILNKGLARHKDDPSLLTNLGIVALNRGDDQTAFNLFEQASKADPKFAMGRLNKAAVYLGAGDHIRARQELDAVLAVEPGNVEALLGLGLAQRMAGEHTDAQKTWQKVLDLDGENAAAHYNLGILAMDFTEQPAVARKHLERYLQLAGDDDPRLADGKDRLSLLEALTKGAK